MFVDTHAALLPAPQVATANVSEVVTASKARPAVAFGQANDASGAGTATPSQQSRS
jgi:hypothetical protein